MFGRRVLSTLRPLGRLPAMPPMTSTLMPAARMTPLVMSRGMATDQELKMRLKSVKNIQKITKAMKMVAAAKLKQVQSMLEVARSYGEGIVAAWPQGETRDSDQIEELGPVEAPEGAKKILYVGLSSDRGLCGGINSSVVKLIRVMANKDTAAGRDVGIFLVGDKSRTGLERQFAQHFTTTISDCAKTKAANFNEASLIAEYIAAEEFDHAVIVYNRFRSAIAYDTTAEPLQGLEFAKKNDEVWQNTSFEGQKSDLVETLYEFRLASQIYTMLIENATSEQSARMQAMDNSSSNASDMIDKLTLMYNRSRQAKITTELTEIISGAAAAEEMDNN